MTTGPTGAGKPDEMQPLQPPSSGPSGDTKAGGAPKGGTMLQLPDSLVKAVGKEGAQKLMNAMMQSTLTMMQKEAQRVQDAMKQMRQGG